MPDSGTRSPAQDARAGAVSFIKKLFAPFAGKKFDEITAADIAASLCILRSKLPSVRKLLAAAAGCFMALKVIRLLRIYFNRKKLIRQIEEEGLKGAALRPEAAAEKLWKLRYRRYRRNRRILNILVSKKTKKSPAYRKFLQVMDELHPKAYS